MVGNLQPQCHFLLMLRACRWLVSSFISLVSCPCGGMLSDDDYLDLRSPVADRLLFGRATSHRALIRLYSLVSSLGDRWPIKIFKALERGKKTHSRQHTPTCQSSPNLSPSMGRLPGSVTIFPEY